MTINHYLSKRYITITLIAFWYIFLFDAFAENNADLNTPDSTNTIFIHGSVVCREGLPVSGLEYRVYAEAGHYPDSIYSSGFTGEDGSFGFKSPGTPSGDSCPPGSNDSDGSFGFTSAAAGTYMMELTGEAGAGRILLSDWRRSPVIVTYPVIDTIVILHTNDQHFTVNNSVEFASTLSAIRKKYDDVYLFSAGDIFVRHPMRWIVNGRLMLEPEWFGERAMFMVSTMNDQGFDLMTPGNHEFSYREPYTRDALETADFKLLAANIEITTDALPPMDAYAILKTSTSINIAVLGLSTTSGNRDGIEEKDVNETVSRYIYLRDSADILVALTHIGLRRDKALAEEFPQFDAIIGGHSHDLLNEAEIINSVLIAHAGGNPHFVSDSHPSYLGKIMLILENGVIKEKSGRVLIIGAEKNY